LLLRRPVLWAGIGLGVITGGMTFFAGALAWTSGNALVGGFQMVATTLMIPGLCAAAMVGSFWIGAVTNLIFYSLLGGLFSLVFRRKTGLKVSY
jgi:hypothetical protein